MNGLLVELAPWFGTGVPCERAIDWTSFLVLELTPWKWVIGRTSYLVWD